MLARPSNAPLVIGLGNAARGDDAAGLVAARRLGGVEHEGDLLALLDVWEGADSAPRSSTSTHAVGLAEAIELARTLGRLPARLVVYGIEGERFEAGTGLTPAVSAALAAVAAAVREAP